MNLSKAVASRLLVACLVATSAAPPLLVAQRAPNVDVWFERGNEFNRGDPGRVMYSADAGSYTTLLRVDTDGRLSVLYPLRPNDRSRFSGGRNGAGVAFQADPTEGVGYVFAVASRTPFDFRAYRGQGDSWNAGTLDQRRMMDPFEIVDRFARSSVGPRGGYSIAYAPYEIGRSGAGRAAYRGGMRYDEGYGGYMGGYTDPWGASPYRQGYQDFRYRGDGYTRRGGDAYGYDNRYNRYNSYSTDPRTRALRHCPDGTLAPYTTPCSAFTRVPPRPDPAAFQPGTLPRPTPQPRPSRRP